MTFTVTMEEIFLLLLGIFVLGIGCYLLVVLKNANHLIVDATKTLTENQEKINNLLTHLEALSGNAADVSGELKRQFDDNKVIVRSIFQTGADSILLINDATSRVRTVVSNFNEILKLVNRLFKKIT
jgi:hypothetical protein